MSTQQQSSKQAQRSRKRRRPKNRSSPSAAPPRVAAQPSRSMNKQSIPPVITNVSQCGRDYWHTLSNPFEGAMGCVPGSLPVRTFKQRVWARGTFSTGATTSGPGGFIIADPLNAVANNVACVIASNNGYSFTDIRNSTASNTLVGLSNSNYVDTDFTSSNQSAEFRVVGAGLRIRYAGTELNRGGYITGLHHPEHYSLVGFTANTMQSFDVSKRVGITNDWFTVMYSPVDQNDYELRNPAFLLPDNVQDDNLRFYMGFWISSAAANQPFIYEFFVVHELVGRNIRATTLSHADPVALAVGATVASASKPCVGSLQQNEANFVSRAVDYLQGGLTTAIKITNLGRAVYQATQGLPPVPRSLMALTNN